MAIRGDVAHGGEAAMAFARPKIFSCQESEVEGGVVLPGQSPLASSCNDDGEHTSKQLDLLLEPWNTGEPETQYVLIVQVPPTAGVELELRAQAEVL
jgi:hypothetical protein